MLRAPLDAYRRVFGQGEGEQILEDLVQRFTQPAKLEGGIDAIIKTYYDAGARDVLEHILRKVEMARQEIRPDATEPDNE